MSTNQRITKKVAQQTMDAWVRHGGASAAARVLGITRNQLHARLRTAQDFYRLKPSAASLVKRAKFRRSLTGVNRFLITSAQNLTPVHAGFLKAMENYCNANNAELLVIPTRYKNPTSQWTTPQDEAEKWFVPTQYLCNERKRLNPNLTLLADVKTQPTASSPLEGFDTITHGESGLLGHTKLQLRAVATPQNRFPKIMSTTGACTVSNYTDTKAGKLGAFHHTLGAALVEVQGKKFHLRQINASKETGAFIDLENIYSADGVRKAGRPFALAMGDTHRDFIAPDVERATFGKGGMVDALKPQWLVWHDLDDNYSVNPHHGANPFIALAKRGANRHRPYDELKRAVDYVQERTPKGCKSAIVFSNHNEFLARWIVNTDWRQLADKENILFYFETAAFIAREAKLGDVGTEYPDAFTYWARKLLPDNGDFVVLNRDQSFMLGEVEHGAHGDDGPNGAPGTLKSFARIGVKSNTFHRHFCGIEEGAYGGGTSTRRKAEYTHGPSSWMNTHIVTYENSKRSLLNVIDDDWRL